MIVEATFNEKSPSMGYIPGKKYVLIVKPHNVISRQDGSGECEYTITGFLKTWTNITVL